MNKQRLSERYPMEAAHFGLCPYCGQTDGHINVESDHFYICKKHKVAWHVGSNLFSAWRYENARIWNRNAKLLSGYETVQPIHLLESVNSIAEAASAKLPIQ